MSFIIRVPSYATDRYMLKRQAENKLRRGVSNERLFK